MDIKLKIRIDLLKLYLLENEAFLESSQKHDFKKTIVSF